MTIAARDPMVSRQTMTRIPTLNGEYLLALYTGSADNKEHLALVIGDVAGQEDVLIRIHSECFTGDVLGSLRCDCGEQLERAMQEIGSQGTGVILYLRQEGRGIGLLEKLRAYNLQDLGHDTVEANLMLGHEADERDYTVAAQILEDLKIASVQVMTNNPLKITELRKLGVSVTRRVPIEIAPSPDSLSYLRTKANRMSHMLAFNGAGEIHANDKSNGNRTHVHANGNGRAISVSGPAILRKSTRPSVTISYAQSIDGSIASSDGSPVMISGKQSLTMTHRLRSSHDAILVGINTALADNPRLTVRLVTGTNPQPVIIDSHLRLKPDAALFAEGAMTPWIITTDAHDIARRSELESAGAMVMPIARTAEGRVDLQAALDLLGRQGISSLMVEGGSGIIQSFMQERLVDQMVVTVSPRLVGGLRVLNGARSVGISYPSIRNVRYQRLGDDIVLWGRPEWESA